MAALATVLKVEIVAEGVETEDQASFLRAIGIDKGQGWLWSKAIGPSELQTWLA
jgi:sensor c-di-GMP phosphodiesterase-like protein